MYLKKIKKFIETFILKILIFKFFSLLHSKKLEEFYFVEQQDNLHKDKG